jgi:hypothetical protein
MEMRSLSMNTTMMIMIFMGRKARKRRRRRAKINNHILINTVTMREELLNNRNITLDQNITHSRDSTEIDGNNISSHDLMRRSRSATVPS